MTFFKPVVLSAPTVVPKDDTKLVLAKIALAFASDASVATRKSPLTASVRPAQAEGIVASVGKHSQAGGTPTNSLIAGRAR